MRLARPPRTKYLRVSTDARVSTKSRRASIQATASSSDPPSLAISAAPRASSPVPSDAFSES